MANETTARQRGPLQSDERPAVSYLVRFWLEPQAREGEVDLFRGYARDLRSGEERYFGDPDSLSEHIFRRLSAMHSTDDTRGETDEVERAIG